jgi:hypothetical protein
MTQPEPFPEQAVPHASHPVTTDAVVLERCNVDHLLHCPVFEGRPKTTYPSGVAGDRQPWGEISEPHASDISVRAHSISLIDVDRLRGLPEAC